MDDKFIEFFVTKVYSKVDKTLAQKLSSKLFPSLKPGFLSGSELTDYLKAKPDFDINDAYRMINSLLKESKEFEILYELSEFMREIGTKSPAIGAKHNLIKQNRNHFESIEEDYDFKSLQLGFEPHLFQIELAKQGLNGHNNLICVRTGAGKTLISALICKYWYQFYKTLNQLSSFKVAFIVPTRSLAEQQCSAFEKSFPESALKEIKEKDSEKHVADAHRSNSIIFLTAKKLVNTIEKGFLKASDFTIIVFDECHHTDLAHPYSELMNLYYQELGHDSSKDSLKPLIIGLTASIGVGKTGFASDQIIKLLANLDCEAISYLTQKELMDNLKNSIPSPNDDEMLIVGASRYNIFIHKHLNHTLGEIEAACEGVEFSKSFLISMGMPQFENYLYELRSEAARNNNQIGMIAWKYMNQLNLLYMRLSDVNVEYCLKDSREFIQEQKGIKEKLDYERKCLHFYTELIALLESSQLGENPKLLKLMEVIKQSHCKDSRGYYEKTL